jgi:predicted nucleotidyltransferase
MRTISDINELEIPYVYKKVLMHMLKELKNFPVVKSAILFGSCARGETTSKSDIDLALIVSEPISVDEEGIIDESIRDLDDILPCDVLVIPEARLHGDTTGNNVIRPILLEGVMLDELLHKC